MYNFCLRRSLFQEEVRERNINAHRSLYEVPVNLFRLFEKYSNMKFNENLAFGSRVAACGRTDGKIGIPKPIVAFRTRQNTHFPIILCSIACLRCIFKQGLSSLTCYAAATTRFHPVTRLRWVKLTLYAYMVLWTETDLLYLYTLVA
jgi:hypothetical protein